METTTAYHLSPTSTFDTMASSDSSHFLKLEDLHTTAASSPAPSAFDAAVDSQHTPPPVIITSKPAKKRKSWGQELPEPKTALPPRKRAKTDDEKEQRRIERIKRNRAAAHNSRERKRQETETLAVALARANAELDAYRKLHGPLPASIILPEVTLCTEDVDTPTPSLVDSHDTDKTPLSPDSLPDRSIDRDFVVKQEPMDSTFSSLPPSLISLGAKSAASAAAFSRLDPTQHSAAMLCDLPCRSTRLNRSSNSSRSPSKPTMATTATISWWSKLFLHLMTMQIQTCYRTLLVALWTASPSRMARMMQASITRSSTSRTSSTFPPRPLRSTRRRLALPRAATGLSAPQRRSGASTALQQREVVSLGSSLTSASRVNLQRFQARGAAGGQGPFLGSQDASRQCTRDVDNEENGVRREEPF